MKREPASATAEGSSKSQNDVARTRGLTWVGRAGLAVLFVAACAFGVLEVHFSTDTWIGLAAGRAISESEVFPIEDTFSYTFAGASWLNQNWLSHLVHWQVYSRLGPAALVVFNWVLAAAMFALVLAATRLRSGSGTAAVVAASLIGVACRDWLSIRPATIQFLLLSIVWLSLSALISDRACRSWWPLVCLAGALLIWPHAHGSFVFGFGLVLVWVACAALPRMTGRPSATAAVQVWAVVLIAAATLTLGAIASPFGIENLFHPFKVAGSAVFRQVGEWRPPFVGSPYPPVVRFWFVVAVAAAGPIVARIFARVTSEARAEVQVPTEPVDRTLFDLASLTIGLGLALWARRFAPMFYILATPALVAATLREMPCLPVHHRRRLAAGLLVVTWSGAAIVGALAAIQANRQLGAWRGDGEGAELTLLERVTCMHRSPAGALRFLGRNRLRANVFSEWKMGGPILFSAPDARVFIDGRSQQVYDEQHYLKYKAMVRAPAQQHGRILEVLAQEGTDIAILPAWPRFRRIGLLLTRSEQWVRLFAEPNGITLVRRDSALRAELARRERARILWWPDSPSAAEGRRALVLVNEPSVPQ